jgi:flagellar motor switch protein FliN/FliY
MTVRRLLGLAKGSIIQLEAPQGEPLTVRANGNAVARGEVVSVNGHYGVRITKIQDPDGSSR